MSRAPLPNIVNQAMDAKSNEDTWTPFENIYEGEEIKCFVLTSIEITKYIVEYFTLTK
jgi:hypothetical protein